MGTRHSSLLRCLGMAWLILAVVLLLGASEATAQQAPTSEFQLDGGAGTNTAYPACVYGPCDTWNQLNPTPSAGVHAGTSVFQTHSNTQFIGGGSKDANPISQWSCTSKNVPPKDFLTNAYAAAYSAPNNDLVTIFGGDRSSVNGSSNIGIWFFQQTVLCNTATGSFSGAHTNGDIFIVSAFSNGGVNSTITVYKWNSTCTAAGSPIASCAAANLQQLFTAANAACDTTEGANSSTASYSASGTVNGAAACATTNAGAGSAGTFVDWPWPNAGGPTPAIIPATALFTGGADITNVLNQQVCFSSFLMETRSSPTVSATLKDFIGGSFNVCSVSVSKSCPNPGVINANGTGFTDTWTGTVCNTSFGTLTGAVVTDTLAGGTPFHPTLSSTTLTAKGTPGACATYTVTANTTNLTITNAVQAKAFFGNTEIDASSCNGTSGANCTAMATCNNSASSTVTINKHCAAPGLSDLSCSGSGCVVVVPYTAQVCNTGQSQLTNIQVQDYPNPGTDFSPASGSFTIAALNPNDCTGSVTTTTACGGSNPACPTGYTCSAGGFCVTPANIAGTYIPTNFDKSSDGVSNGRFLFDDKISVTQATAAIGSNPSAVPGCTNPGDVACSGQTCPLCPQGECSTSPLP